MKAGEGQDGNAYPRDSLNVVSSVTHGMLTWRFMSSGGRNSISLLVVSFLSSSLCQLLG